MDFTGERFIPEAGLDGELAVEHFLRYHALLDLVRDKVVLDAASGEGYGSDLLASRSQRVCGLEIDPEAVRLARRKYQRPNLEYIRGTIAALPFPTATFDVAVSFETIEHVPGELQAAFLGEVKRVLKPEGVLLISTPDKRIYSDLARYHNEFHVQEFYRQEFRDFLGRHFNHVKFWEQTAMLSYLLTDGQGALRQLGEPPEIEGKYIVAQCSDLPLAEIGLGAVVLDREDRYRRSMARVLELQDEVEEKNRHIRIVLNDIGICETTIRQQEQTLKEQALQFEQRIASLHDELVQQQQRSADLESALVQATARLQHIEGTKAWRLIQALHRLHSRIRRSVPNGCRLP